MNKQDKQLKVSVQTFGCQMNVYDSEVATGLLSHQGYQIVQEHDGDKNQKERGPKYWCDPDADVVIMNTCSVREHAEDRVYSRLGMLGKAKEKNPDLIIGLMGCMVEEHRERLFKRFPHLDLMVGTRNIKEVPSLIEEVRRTRRQVAKIKQDGLSIEYTDQIKRQGKYHAWLPIMTGCNKVCTFCIVPITRGSEVSMPAREVYREASRLVGEGVKWITLLGQNVNSYRGNNVAVGANPRVRPDSEGQTHGSAPTAFPQLLETLCQIEGLERISFTTSHPHDATEELFQVIAGNPKISRRFHLPLQAGSDRILKRMKRLHTYQEYKAKIDRLRELVPDIVVTTDIIAGFSGETEEDYQDTVRALQELRYDGAYIYKYSVRPATPAAKLPDDVPLEVKERRNAKLLELQKKIEAENNHAWIGRTVTAFFERVSQYGVVGSDPLGSDLFKLLVGRTDQEKRIYVEGPAEWVGTLQKVCLTGLRHETFTGRLL